MKALTREKVKKSENIFLILEILNISLSGQTVSAVDSSASWVNPINTGLLKG